MKAELYTKPTCPYCVRAIKILTDKGIELVNHDVSQDPALRAKASERAGGHSTVPMIFLDEKFIGGCSELQALVTNGSL